ncbi:MAG: hypothetical protein A2808_02250 [Candidatus Moranbacteria bacterium RIFCSPHIGHO2_01_FULL_55_24]|nr:MAG: hypothetical protein A2808_02250 [Candidatus Moranbacteria bacterium RIFCSPHIGHO2_01_FULL_55_24]
MEGGGDFDVIARDQQEDFSQDKPFGPFGQSAPCCADHDQEAALLYVPYLCMEHRPLSTVPYQEVKALLDEGLITLCDGRQIYEFKGQGIATICSDPSVRKPKVDILNGRGELAIYSIPGIGLKFSPKSPVYSPTLVEEIQDFISRTNGHYRLKKLLVIGAHFPCGYAQHGNGRQLSLREKIGLVADGACHMKRHNLFEKVIATVFITTKMPDGSTQLGWYHIKKSLGRDDCQLL